MFNVGYIDYYRQPLRGLGKTAPIMFSPNPPVGPRMRRKIRDEEKLGTFLNFPDWISPKTIQNIIYMLLPC